MQKKTLKIANKERVIIKNTSMLLLLNITKIVVPFVTLPYLTRVLSTEVYGVVAYVKAIMSYMQVIIDFGFMLSATKEIVDAKNDKDIIGKIVGTNILAKLLLAGIAGIILSILSKYISILHNNLIYTFLSYIVVILTIFLFDFLFKGIEQMQIITIRFVLMKGFATLFTFLIVKSDKDILWIPVLDILGSLISIFWVGYEVKKLKINVKIENFKDSLLCIKKSAVYFLSNVASTSFNVFNTIILGIVLPATEIAYWSICMQIINAIQALYIPVSDAIYPEMVRSKNIKLIYKTKKYIGPIVFLVTMVTFLGAKIGLYMIGGSKYVDAYIALRLLSPVIVFGFFRVLYGWPTLGAIGKVKENTKSTIIAALFQIAIVIILWIAGKLTLVSMAISRSVTEIIMYSIRFYYYKKYRDLFKINNMLQNCNG